jgi:hypothetical protein
MGIPSSLTLEFRCPSCGQTYDVSLANVLKSQQMLNEGCACRGEPECPPLYLASLLSEDDLNLLSDVLERLNAQAAAQGAKLLLTPSQPA